MAALPYFLYSDRHLAEIKQGVEAAVNVWQAKWFFDAPLSWQVALVDNAYNADSASLLQHHQDGCLVEWNNDTVQTGLTAHVSTSAMQRIFLQASGELGMGVTTQSPLTLATGKEIIKDLFRVIAAKSQGAVEINTPNAPNAPNATLQPLVPIPAYKGSGSVLMVLRNGEQEIHCLISAAVARAYLRADKSPIKRRGLVHRKSAIGKGVLKLRVDAGEVQLKLSDLLALAPGNIVRLNLTVGDAFHVMSASTHQPVCKAVLGQQAGHKAVQLFTE